MTANEVVTVYVVHVVYVWTIGFIAGAGPPATDFGVPAKSVSGAWTL